MYTHTYILAAAARVGGACNGDDPGDCGPHQSANPKSHAHPDAQDGDGS